MKKLKLNLLDLCVESFMSESQSGEGTVVANSGTAPSEGGSGCPNTCVYWSCHGPGICFPDSGPCGSGIDGC